MTTICVKCKHHNGAQPQEAWYNHKCLHPLEKRPIEVDPVTGIQVYAVKNSLGLVSITDESSPYCRDINQGNCPMFEPNGVIQNIVNIVKEPFKKGKQK